MAYKVRPGFRFPLFSKAEQSKGNEEPGEILRQAETALQQAESVVTQLRELCGRLTT